MSTSGWTPPKALLLKPWAAPAMKIVELNLAQKIADAASSMS